MPAVKDSIAATRQGFEAAFAEKNFYAKQTKDDAHLAAILDLLPVRPGMKILDLGTGTGYLAFALAEKYPDVTVTGLDIVDKTISENTRRAKEQHLDNLSFLSYDGITFPFAGESFDIIASRYVLHHFPDIDKCFEEVSRTCKDGGRLFISDPAPNTEDTAGFVDEYMQIRPDGHIKFYTAAEWRDLGMKNGFALSDSFISSVRFPRKLEQSYIDIIGKYCPAVTESYDIKIINDEVYITEQVNNMLFNKHK